MNVRTKRSFNILLLDALCRFSQRLKFNILQDQKQVSKSYEYKLKSVIKRKISTLLEKELPLLSKLFPNLDLTKNSKGEGLSSRKSRVQIPAGASVILNSETNLRSFECFSLRHNLYTVFCRSEYYSLCMNILSFRRFHDYHSGYRLN